METLGLGLFVCIISGSMLEILQITDSLTLTSQKSDYTINKWS